MTTDAAKGHFNYLMIRDLIHCCTDMQEHIKQNHLIHYSDAFDEYGINCVEDGNSYVLIEYCPWCGRKLPFSKRAAWFEALEKIGIEDPLCEEQIPEKYKSSCWRKEL